jgi:hypothetical protein
MHRRWDGSEEQDYLTTQAKWAGPVKLAERHGQVEQRIEFYLGCIAQASLIDDESAASLHGLIDELIALGGSLPGRSELDDWVGPPAEMLSAWLGQAGYETTLDGEGKVCLTLKRLGCDGEVRIACSGSRLRFVMPLGRWADLDASAEAAMGLLAREVNTRGRLMRIAHHGEESAHGYEAQVDLTGLPFRKEADPHRERLWRETVRLAVKGLELALRQLGLELPLLADPRHRDLAELVLQHARGARGRTTGT